MSLISTCEDSQIKTVDNGGTVPQQGALHEII